MYVFPGSDGSEPEDVAFCRRYDLGLTEGRLSSEEYYIKLTNNIAHTDDENVQLCLDTIRPQVVAGYAEYLRELLVPADFMPIVPFLHYRLSLSEVEEKRVRLRPRFIQIYDAVLARLASASGPEPAT